MQNQHRQLLRTLRVHLVENITRHEELLDILESDHIISDEQRLKITSPRGEKDRTRLLLDTIVRCGPAAFDAFQKALEQTKQESISDLFQSHALPPTLSNTHPVKPRSFTKTPTVNEPSNANTQISLTQHFKPYRISSMPRGYILIINIEHYSELSNIPTRHGSGKDVEKLQQLFREICYSVAVLHDLDGLKLQEAVKSFATKSEHNTVDACGLFILSHGMEHDIIAADGTLVNIDKLLSCFTNPQCPGLVNKPKLLVVQACRGSEIDRGVLVTSSVPCSTDFSSVDHSLDSGKFLSLPYMSDCVIVYTTLPGFVSFRSELEGSVYIGTFVEVFNEYGKRFHVMDLLAEVNNRLMKQSVSINIRQISQPVNTLRKPFYLYPAEGD